jgi:hypothetical protein
VAVASQLVAFFTHRDWQSAVEIFGDDPPDVPPELDDVFVPDVDELHAKTNEVRAKTTAADRARMLMKTSYGVK